MVRRVLCVLRLITFPVLVLLTVTTACSSGSAGGGSASCSTSPATEGAGWNLGRPPIDPAAAARAAVFMGSCVPDDKPQITLEDFYISRSEDSARDLDVVACLGQKSNGCQAVAECAGITARYGATCGAKYACQGDRLTICDGDLETQVDCSKSGARCDANAGCVPCNSPPSASSCDYDTFTEHCEDGRPVYCHKDQVTTGPRCSDLGLDCLPDPYEGTSYDCFGPGGECQALGGPGLLSGTACAGNTLVACVGGREFQIDCGEIGAGFTCQNWVEPNDTSFFCGLAAECDGSANPPADPSCDGNSVVLCNAGRVEKIDCVALGFTGCAPQWGRCIPGPYSQI